MIGRNRNGSWETSGAGRSVLAVGVSMLLLLAAATVRLGAQAPAPVRTVDKVDLSRYAGDWFEIARFPNKFQRQCLGDVRASYDRRDDGRIDVVNRCRTEEGMEDAKGVARVADTNTSARLEVRFAPSFLSFLPFVWGDYWVLGLAGDYSWATVGAPNREYLWILARKPVLSDADYAAALAAATTNGFDVRRLVKTPQAESR